MSTPQPETWFLRRADDCAGYVGDSCVHSAPPGIRLELKTEERRQMRCAFLILLAVQTAAQPPRIQACPRTVRSGKF